ncbi:hypothetical protein BHM03_00025802 [Ensete ventricosum]|nr:hypothetical protein BHM03_00025802 [Ensete ventricosum]
MHSVIRHCVIFIKSCGSEKIAQQQDRNHMRHAYPWCEQPPRYATLNTPAEDAVKTYGKESSNAKKAPEILPSKRLT